jgi:hypothetical protein
VLERMGRRFLCVSTLGVWNSERFRMLECMLQKGRRPELRGRTSEFGSFAGMFITT